MIDSMHVLDVLQKRGYAPADLAAGEHWFDGPSGFGGQIRVVLDEEGGSVIYMFAGYALRWSATLSPDAPGSVFLAALDAAEREAAP